MLSAPTIKTLLIHRTLELFYAKIQIFLFVLYSGHMHDWPFLSMSSETISFLN